MKFLNARDTIYSFSSKESLLKFIWEVIGHDFFLDDNDIWKNGEKWCIRSKTIREIKNRTE